MAFAYEPRRYVLCMACTHSLIRNRKLKGLTAKTVAQRMGISKQAYAKYEGYSIVPTLHWLFKYAAAVDVPPDRIVAEIYQEFNERMNTAREGEQN